MKVAIFGAAGAIGRVVAAELQARGDAVRVVGRRADALRKMAPGAEIFAADLADPGAARNAAAGMDAIVFCVGVPYDHFELHPQLARVALDAARDAGVREFVLVSNVYPYGRPRTPRVAEDHPREPHTRKGRYRKEQQDLVLAAHDPNGLRTLVLVLPDFYGPGVESSFVTAVFDAARTGKTANVIGPIDTPHEFVFVPDVAPVIAELLRRPDAFGTIYNLAGPEAITTRDFIAQVERTRGRPLRRFVVGPLLLRFFGLFVPLLRELVEMHYLWTTPVLLDDAKLHGVLGTIRKTPYREGIAASLTS
jgi:nucleoside-diphosphate-sugar epimerase